MKIYKILLQFKRGSVERECDVLKEYLITLHGLAKAEKEKLEEEVKKMADKSPGEADDIYEHYSEQHAIYKTKYVELANNAMLVTAYSFLEAQLKEIRRIVNDFVVIKANANPPLLGSYAKKGKDSIYGMTGLVFSTLDPLWIKIDEVRIIRNLITHNGSNIYQNNGSKEDLSNEALIKGTPEITVENNMDFYINNEQLVLSFIDLIGEYMVKLIRILETINMANIK